MCTHYDGRDVIVLDEQGRVLSDVAEVRVEEDRAIVHVRVLRESLAALPALSTSDRYAIYSARYGQPYYAGAARVVCVLAPGPGRVSSRGLKEVS